MIETTTLQAHYSDAILTKANRLVKMDQVVRDPEDSSVFKVTGSKTYTVRHINLGVDEDGTPISENGMPYVTCDCPNGLARGGRPSCYHSAAVIIILEKEAEEREDQVETPSLDDFMLIEFIDE